MNIELASFARVAWSLALSLDAPEGQPAESMRPALESLMKAIIGRLP